MSGAWCLVPVSGTGYQVPRTGFYKYMYVAPAC